MFVMKQIAAEVELVMERSFLISGLMVVLLLLAGCQGTLDTSAPAQQQAQTIPTLPTFTPTDIALGEKVYAINCASCHGETLAGEADWKQQNDDGSFRSPPHSADGHTWHHADNVLIESIEKGGARFEDLNIGGTSNMPAFAQTLTDEEIRAVLIFIKSTWPEDIRALQWQQTVQSASR